jgi:hypothetical protein
LFNHLGLPIPRILIYDDSILQFYLPSDLVLAESESYITTDGESASLSWNKGLIWGLRPDFYYCQTVAALPMWGSLSDERTVYNCFWSSPAQSFSGSSPVVLVTIFYCLIRDFPFRRLLRFVGLCWRYSNPPSHGSLSLSLSYITTDGQSASLSWFQAPIWGL